MASEHNRSKELDQTESRHWLLTTDHWPLLTSLNSKIEWTDATWNPIRGCTKISPGCAHCYAETFAERFRGVPGHPYEQGFDLRLMPEKLGEPLRWAKSKMVFVNSMSDLFHEGVGDERLPGDREKILHRGEQVNSDVWLFRGENCPWFFILTAEDGHGATVFWQFSRL